VIRVLHTTMSLGSGGVERLLADLLPLFDRRRVEAELLLLKEEGFRADDVRREGIRVRTLNGTGWGDLSLPLRFRRFLAEGDFDVIHAHLTWPAALAAVFKGRSRLVWHVHDMGESLSGAHLAAERALMGRADRVAAVSEAVAQAVRLRVPRASGRIRVVPNGIRTGMTVDRPGHSGPPVIGFVGRLDEPKKGLDVLLRSIRRVAAARPAVRFVIAGDGPSAAGLRARAEEWGLSGFIEWRGEVRDVPALLPTFDAFVLPSLWEGVPIALIEAMDAGLPVVATRVGGVPEVVVDGETGRLVPPADEERLAAAILEMVDSPSVRRAWGEAGRIRVRERFDVRNTARALESLYEEVLTRGSPTARLKKGDL